MKEAQRPRKQMAIQQSDNEQVQVSMLATHVDDYQEASTATAAAEQTHQLVVSHSDPWWKTFATSYSGGFISVLSGHPFDTLKIRMQTGTTKSLFRHLYRGVLPPLITTPPGWSAQFLLYQASMKIFATDTLSNVAFAGGVSGVIWATVVTPPELIKCYAQRWHLKTPAAMREIYFLLGGSMRSYIVKGLFRGYTAALIRDVPACAAYMWGMEAVRRYVPQYHTSKVLGPFLAGAFAGTFCWIWAYPADTIKSIIQTDLAASKNGKGLPSASFVW
eukprot:CAMPEP_0197041206 /NCGR_PEP_ID=MMETSP1384-20130603/17788_1 /TAXON_ID=29189 /ORGANISM="Ammonia sp." /LENGTH=274 /DNA_ID=CAMNT_0042472087 /DNA_START=38 /DNA_END=859 /DNA_ORIENTATION=-